MDAEEAEEAESLRSPSRRGLTVAGIWRSHMEQYSLKASMSKMLSVSSVHKSFGIGCGGFCAAEEVVRLVGVGRRGGFPLVAW